MRSQRELIDKLLKRVSSSALLIMPEPYNYESVYMFVYKKHSNSNKCANEHELDGISFYTTGDVRPARLWLKWCNAIKLFWPKLKFSDAPDPASNRHFRVSYVVVATIAGQVEIGYQRLKFRRCHFWIR